MISKYYSKLSQRERMVLFATMGCLFLLAMDRIVLGPILAQMKVLDAEIQMKTEIIHRNLRIVAFQESIFKEHGKYKKYLASNKQTEEEIIGDHLHEIESLGKLQAVKISDTKSGDAEENPVMKEYRIKISGEGSLSNILGFMRLLEDSAYLFKIHSFLFAPKTKDASVMKYEMDLSRILINTAVPDEKAPEAEKVKPETKTKETTETKTEEAPREKIESSSAPLDATVSETSESEEPVEVIELTEEPPEGSKDEPESEATVSE